MIIQRTSINSLLNEALGEFPAVALLGTRQVGKTTLARSLAQEFPGAAFLDLEDEADLRKLDDAAAYLGSRSGRLTVIDEIHRAPGLLPKLRGVIDARRRAGEEAGQFLLLGSASLELMRQASETLAGRIAYLDMLPIQPGEAAGAGFTIDQLWLRGGYPTSLRASNDATSYRWRQAYIRSYLERDIPMFAPRMPGETIGRLWRMLATAQGSPLNQSRLAQNLGVTGPMITRYVDLLCGLLMVRRLQPWSGNLGKRLIKAPKVYVRDSGLVHALLGIGTYDELLGHIAMGATWEGFVIESLIAAMGVGSIPLYFRTVDGAEIDLLIEQAGQVKLAVEIKRTSAPSIPKGFHLACDDVSAERRILVHGGKDRWTGSGEVEVMGLLGAIDAVRAATSGPSFT